MMREEQSSAVPIEYVDGLDHVEILGDGRGRFCLYELRRLPEGHTIIVPKRDVIMPLGSLPDAISKCMAVSATHLAGKLYRFIPVSLH